MSLKLSLTLKVRQHFSEIVGQHIRVIFRKHERWFDLDHVMKRTISAKEDSTILHLFDHHGCFTISGLKGLSITNQLNANEESFTTHVANQRVGRLQPNQLSLQVRSNFERVRLQFFV